MIYDEKMEVAGIEPVSGIHATDLAASGCANQVTPCAANTLHEGDTDCRSAALDDAALRYVVAAWNALPQKFRQAIVMLVESQVRT